MAEASTSSSAPRSWAEDLNSYRTTRGSQSFKTVTDTQAPVRFYKTRYAPFGDTQHPQYTLGDVDTPKEPTPVDLVRWAKRGLGDQSKLKQQGLDGSLLEPEASTSRPRLRPQDARPHLFKYLSGQEGAGSDSWIGHMQIDPSKGKGHAAPKADRTGRTDLFDVLATRRPGVPADDGWLGHIAINPAVGKARPPGPEQRAGRQDLFPILQQKILDDPQRAQLLKRGADNLGDAWCGNLAIGVHSGKKPAAGTEMAFVNHIVGGGGALRTDLADDDVSPWDRPKPPPPADSHRVKYSRDIVGDILTAKATVPPREEGKRQYPRSIPAPDTVTDIYGLMTFKPLSPAAQAAVKLNSSRKAPFPGHPATQSTGNEMLLHRSSLLPRRGPYY